MRIAVIGKGGSGKSTVSASLIKHAAQQSQHVVAIDADINRHLSLLLGIQRHAIDLGSRYEEVFTYLEGLRVDVDKLSRIPEVGSIPVSTLSRKISFSADDAFFKRFAIHANNISLLTAGTYEDEDVGMTCIHVKLKALELALHRFCDAVNDVVVIDVTAGTDPLSTTLVYAYDLHVVVVEPTRKSLRVFEDYSSAAKPIGDRIFALGNKISSPEDLEFIKNTVGIDRLIGFVPQDETLQEFNLGQPEKFDVFVERHQPLWNSIIQKGSQLTFGRAERLDFVTNTFRNSCKSWFNEYYSMPVDKIFLDDSSEMNVLQETA